MGYCGYCSNYTPTANCENNCRLTGKSVGFLQERECFTQMEMPQVKFVKVSRPAVKPEPSAKSVFPERGLVQKDVPPAFKKRGGPPRTWSDADLEYLKQAYAHHTAREIGEKLGKTPAAVARMLQRLGIKLEKGRGGKRKV